jgi:hypothetical protein
MGRTLSAVVALLALNFSAHASAAVAPSTDAAIVVTINPEGRISVTLGPFTPSPARRGTPVDWPVKVINQGFSTGRLIAQLVGDPPPGAVLDFHPERLKGLPLEMRMMRITLTNSAPTDITIAFLLANETPDFGGRDRIHLLVRPL